MIVTKFKEEKLSYLFISTFLLNLFFIYFVDLLKIELKTVIVFMSIFTHSIGILLFIKNIKRFRYDRLFNFYFLFLTLLIVFRIYEASNLLDVYKVTFYKFGFLSFYFFGLETYVAIETLKNKLSKLEFRRLINLLLKVLAIYTFIITISFIKSELNFDINIGNYQSLSDVILIISIFYIIITNISLEKKMKNLYFPIITLSLITFIVGSSATLVFLAANLISDMYINRSKNALLIISIFISSSIFLLFILSNKNLFDNLLSLGLSPGYYEDITDYLSPVLSRLEILKSFPTQFKVAPIFGNWNAEIISGAGLGNYPHSIPLSFLSHTGVVGFILFILLIYNIIKNKIKFYKDIKTKTSLILFLNVIVIGGLSKFLTFIPFWYLLGFLSLNEIKNKKL